MTPSNLITDVAGILVGNADDARLASGVTAIIFEEPAVAAVDVRGGAPGTRETDLLEPHRTVERIDAVVLSGGSAFGLDAGAGVQAWLRERGRGFGFEREIGQHVLHQRLIDQQFQLAADVFSRHLMCDLLLDRHRLAITRVFELYPDLPRHLCRA